MVALTFLRRASKPGTHAVSSSLHQSRHGDPILDAFLMGTSYFPLS
jgi:hypothetical protein